MTGYILLLVPALLAAALYFIAISLVYIQAANRFLAATLLHLSDAGEAAGIEEGKGERLTAIAERMQFWRALRR